MTLANDNHSNNTHAADKEDVQLVDKDNEKPSGILANIIDKATKSGLGRKKLDPSAVETAVAQNMADIHNNPTKLRLACLGGGSFGTAMANLAARNGCDVKLWVRIKRTVISMAKSQVNKKFLPG